MYLRGQFLRVHLNRESAAQAVACYDEALKLDPGFALAWAGLARAVSDQIGQNFVAREEGYAKATHAAQRAIELEPDLPEAHIARGWILRAWDWDWKGAEESFERALALAPANAMALNAAATLFGNLGRLDEATALLRRAVGLDPLNVAVNRNLGLYCLANGEFDAAAQALDVTLQLSAKGGLTHTWRALVELSGDRLDEALAEAESETSEIFRLVALAVVHARRGEDERSDAALAELVARNGEDSPYQVAEVHAQRGEGRRGLHMARARICLPRPRAFLRQDRSVPRPVARGRPVAIFPGANEARGLRVGAPVV